jgi:hypothetical protein
VEHGAHGDNAHCPDSSETTTDAQLFGSVRRVVTGHDEHNKSILMRDEMVEPICAAIFGHTGIHWLYGASGRQTIS